MTETLELSQREDAWLLMMQHRHGLIHCSGGWRKWNGQWWKSESDSAIEADLKNELLHHWWKRAREGKDVDPSPVTAHAIELTNDSEKFKAVIDQLKVLLQRKPEDFNKQRELMNLRNGVLNLDSGTMTAPSEAYYMNCMAGVGLISDAPSESWQSFLAEITSCNAATMTALERFAAGALKREQVPEEFFVLVGLDGVQIFMNVIRKVLGDYADYLPRIVTTATTFTPENLVNMWGEDVQVEKKKGIDERITKYPSGVRVGQDSTFMTPTHTAIHAEIVPLELANPRSKMNLNSELPGIFTWMLNCYLKSARGCQ